MRSVRLVTLAALGALACGGSDGAGPRYLLTISAGDGQADTIGKALPVPYAVTVTDPSGTPAGGVPVTWTVTSGGGSITPSSTTDGSGVATAVRTLGPEPGTAAAKAEAGGASVTFTATALPGVGAVLVTSVPIPQNYGIHDQFIRDGLAFVCAWNTGVIIYDVGNGMKGGSPANPVLVDSVTTAGGEVHNAWWFHNPVTNENRYLFIGQEGSGTIGAASSGDIHVVDVSDLNNIHEVGFFHRPDAGTHNFWMDEADQILYAAYYNGGVVAIDVSGTLSGDISSRMIDTLSFGAGNTYTWGVQLYNGSLYAMDMVSGFWQLHTANGTLSVAAGGNNVPERYGSDLWVANGYAYTGTWGFRSTYGNAVKIWQLDATGAPTLVDSIVTPDITTVSDVEVSDDGKLLMFSTENGPNSGFWFYRLTDPAHPVFIARYLVGGLSNGVHTATFSRIASRLYAFGAKDPSGAALMILDVTSLDQ
jgi:hypothetical protein